jgi:type IV secretory pathway VirD2 relaxase
MTALMRTIGFESYNNRKKGDPKAAAKRHTKYIEEEKAHHRNKPVLFNDKENVVNRIDFYQKINKQPNRGVVAHKFILSLSEEEWKRGKIDLREWTRETMSSYQMKNKKQLDWVGAIHLDEGHPHVHIVVRGIDNQGRQVGFYPKNINQMQTIVEQQRERLEKRNTTRELERDRDLFKELEAERSLTPAPEKNHEKIKQREFTR